MAMSNYWMIRGRVKSYNVFCGVFFSEIPFQFRVLLPSSTRLYICAVFFVSKIGHESIPKNLSWLHLGDLRGERKPVSVAVDLA